MDVKPKNITVMELVERYQDNQEAGVVGFGGKLNIRPPYQREFVYNDKQRNAVIDTIVKNFPLNTMYWAVTPEGFELLDGQQRTMSICQYVAGVFSYKDRYFHNLQQDEKESILNYKLTIYQCQGTDSEKLDWFRTINIAGEKLTEQELRNAVYSGSWTADAKRYFSKTQCAAWKLADVYMTGSPIRQEFLEKTLGWISEGKIEGYMSRHQHDTDAQELWQYFQEVVAWVERIFPTYRKIMKGLNWGSFYNAHKNNKLNAAQLEERIKTLIDDEEVDSPKGIYEYLLTGNEKSLNLRAFDEKIKVKVYEKQKGKCPICKKLFDINEMEADHILPWSKGGRTTIQNCQMLCRMDNRTKSGK